MIVSFHMNVRNHRMRAQMNIEQVKTVNDLYALADQCARAEEGRRLPGKDAGAGGDSEDDDASTPKKTGQKRNRKHKGKTVMAVEGAGDTAAKKPKAEDTGSDLAACSCDQEAAAGEQTGKTKGPYCKIHRTKGYSLNDCRQLEQLAEKQKQEYEKHDKEKVQNGTGGSGNKNRGGCGGRRPKGQQQKEKPARDREKKEGEDDGDDDDEDSEGQEFQKAVEAMCVDRGASLHSSHRQLKQWVMSTTNFILVDSC
jgi:hypothetical protein